MRTFFIEEKLKEYQSFETVEKLDKARQSVYYHFKDKFTGAILKVWNVISQHSCNVPGVSYIRIETIQKVAKVSRSSVERAIRLFKKLNVIQVIETTRQVKGGDGANIYVIKPFEEQAKQQNEGAQIKGRQNAETPYESKDQPQDSPEETINSFKTYLNNINSIRKGESSNDDSVPVPKFIPKEFVQVAKKYSHDAKVLFELWGKIRLGYVKSGSETPIEHLTDIAVEAFRESFGAIKLRNLRKGNNYENFKGYLYCTANRLFAEQRRKEASKVFDWHDFINDGDSDDLCVY